MALPTDPPYCLMYPNIYSSTIPEKDRHHFNIRGSPPGVHTCVCICRALLQHANKSADHRQQHHRSHLVIPWGVQYDHLLPKIMMLRNHQAPLVDLSMGEPFPLVPVGDFQLEDNIFPGTPSDSLLYTSKELMKLRKMRFQVTTHRPTQTLAVRHEDETSQLSHGSGEVPSSTSKNGDPPKATGSLGRKSSRCKLSLPSKECHGSRDKDSHSSSSKHQDKPCKDKENSKSPCKCTASPARVLHHMGRKGAPPRRTSHGLQFLILKPSPQRVR